MRLPQSEAPHLHLERARDREGGLESAWCTDYWRGECPGRAQWGETGTKGFVGGANWAKNSAPYTVCFHSYFITDEACENF